MGNVTQTLWRHRLDSDALRAWLDFDLERLGGGCFRFEWSPDGSAQLNSQLDEPELGWTSLCEFWLAGPCQRLESSSGLLGHAQWIRESMMSGAALAFCGGFCRDEGIGNFCSSTREKWPDFNQVAGAIATTGLFFSPVSDLTPKRMAEVSDQLESWYGARALRGLGFDQAAALSGSIPAPWTGSRGWGAVVEARRKDIDSSRKADDWLLPFCGLTQEAPPQWLVDQASPAGAKRAMLSALRACHRDAAAMLARRLPFGDLAPEKVIDKAFMEWGPVFKCQNQHPATKESLASSKQASLAIFEAVAIESQLPSRAPAHSLASLKPRSL